MIVLAWLLIFSPALVLVYAIFVYPAALWFLGTLRTVTRIAEPRGLPTLTITVPVYNEGERLGGTLKHLLSLDYPEVQRQIIVISDASSDNTDDVARSFATRGVQLIRLSQRRGKTAAENAAAESATGEIIVNIDATVRVSPNALRLLVAAFNDPTVGVASGRDVSTGDVEAEGNQSEAGYVGYEMWVRSMETRLDSIVGASGCFFATRRELFDAAFPEELSRDFASALIARERGYRAVSVDAAICYVPRTRSLRAEFNRKVRTMARGLATLEFKRHLLNAEKYGLFAWMLLSHKLCRWLFYVGLPFAAAGALLLLFRAGLGAEAVTLLVGVIAVSVLALKWPEGKRMPSVLALPAFVLLSNIAGVAAWWLYLSGQRQAVWEPTRRPA